MKKLEVVVGGQYGSEAKGHVTTRLLDKRHEQNSRFSPDALRLVNVRVAGPNAGHTGYDADGRAWPLRSVPVGATRPQPVTLVIAPGSEIDPDVLIGEVRELTDAGLMDNKALIVSPDATLIEDRHKIDEVSQLLVQRAGSTAKGIGAARADRIMRNAKRVRDDELLMKELRSLKVVIGTWNPTSIEHVIIEGTQGYGLGLHGKHYPQCTSSDCRAIDFVAMAGLNPWGTPVMVWVVARMFPIRVAGNSGYLKDETTWEALGLPEERTTVTKKVRRVGMWDDELIDHAVQANGGHPAARVALTMIDQRWPDLAGASSWQQLVQLAGSSLYDQRGVGSFIQHVERTTRARVGMLTTGPKTGLMF